MNRTDRLLALILELQRGGPRTAAALAARFETSKRTIYRDLDTLREGSLPLAADRGPGGHAGGRGAWRHLGASPGLFDRGP